MSLPLAPLFLLSVALHAQPKLPAAVPQAQGKSVQDTGGVDIKGCSSQETREIRAALDIALLYTKNCLGTSDAPGLAPDIGQKIVDLVENRRVDFECTDSVDSTEGETTFDAYYSHIKMASWPPPSLKDPSLAHFGGVALHELIHAVDPIDEYIVSVDAHNNGFADRVFACQMACQGKAYEGQFSNMVLLEAGLGGELPKKKGYRCEREGQECDLLKKLAHICSPAGGAKVLKAARIVGPRAAAAKCLMRAAFSETSEVACNAKACVDARAAYEQEGAAMGVQRRDWMAQQAARFSAIGKAIRTDDPRGLSSEDQSLMTALVVSGAAKKCGAGP